MGKGDSVEEFQLLPKIINGGIAGLIGVACCFPLDLVKTRLQTQQFGPNGERMYTSLWDCFKKTYKSEGYFGMYKGSGVNMLLVTPEKATKLATNDLFRYHLRLKDGSLSIPRQMLAGGLAGFCQSIITTPMDLLKIQMQDFGRIADQFRKEGKPVPKMSGTQLAIDMIKKYGFFGLYKGFSATMGRDTAFSGMFFPLFSILNDLGPKRDDGSGETVFWCSFLCGCVAGAVAAFLLNPLDVVKTRLQALTKGKGERSYTGIADAFVKILRYEGITAFFKGASVRVIVVAPMNGIAQMVYYFLVAEKLLGLQKNN